jgi:hypothetical protein
MSVARGSFLADDPAVHRLGLKLPLRKVEGRVCANTAARDDLGESADGRRGAPPTVVAIVHLGYVDLNITTMLGIRLCRAAGEGVAFSLLFVV